MQRRLLMTYVALIATTMVLAVFVSWRSVNTYFVDRTEESAVTEAYMVKRLISEGDMNQSNVQSYIDELAEAAELRITLIDQEGVVLADSDSNASEMDNHKNRPEVRDALSGEASSNVRFSNTMGAYYFYYALPIETELYSGVLRIAIPSEEVEAFTREMISIIFIGVAIGSVIAFLLAYVMTNRLMRPVNELTNVAKKIAEGSYDEKIYLDQNDQIGELADAFNAMTHVLRKNIWELTRKNAELESILTSMGSGLAAVNNDYEIALYNESFVRMLNLKDQNLENRLFYEVVRELTVFEVVEKSIKDQEYLNRETVINTNGEDAIIRVTATPIFDRENANRHLGALIVLMDVTQIRKLENMRRDFVSNVTHELKTPLTSIRGFVDTLKNGAIKEEEVALRFLDIIDIETERLASLIQDILALSEIENVVGERNADEQDFSKIIHEVIDIIPRNHEGVEILTEIQEDLPGYTCNRNRMKQLMINLVDNSVKYTEEGHVKIKANESHGYLNISVEDIGVGIEHKHLSRIFERFYRVDKGRSRKMGGTGLGLSIVKHIVELYNGEINIDSEIGEGTTISIRLPY